MLDLNIKLAKENTENKRTPKTIEQLIQKYKLDSLWTNIVKIVNEVVEQSTKDINADRIKTGTLSADRIKGGSLKLGGENNTNGSLQVVDSNNENIFTVTKDGIKSGVKELLGKQGVLSNLQFGEFEWSKVGYSSDSIEVSEGEYLYLNIPIFIPENFNILSAKVSLYHCPTKWTYNNTSVWGYCRNLKLYKKEDNNNYCKEVYLNSESFPENDLFDTEVTNAFGENGFTAQIPNDESYVCENTTSIDIKSFLTTNKNIVLQIRSSNTIPELDPDIGNIYQTNYLNQSAHIKAIVNIVGFMK